METTEQKLDGVPIRTLTKEEMSDPYAIMREFVEDVSLAAIRNLIVTMRDICITTDNVFYGGSKEREDLLYVTQKIIRFFEAAYELKKDLSLAGKIIQADFPAKEQLADIRNMRVMERTFFKRSKGGSVTVPSITLLGKWLELAGFNPGDEITIASKFQTLLISMNKEWDRRSGAFRQRA